MNVRTRVQRLVAEVKRKGCVNNECPACGGKSPIAITVAQRTADGRIVPLGPEPAPCTACCQGRIGAIQWVYAGVDGAAA